MSVMVVVILLKKKIIVAVLKERKLSFEIVNIAMVVDFWILSEVNPTHYHSRT
jgi:hypothetical protein